MAKYLIKLAAAALIAIISGVCIAGFMINNWSKERTLASESVILPFPRGTSLKSLSNSLEEEGVISSSLYYNIWVRVMARDYDRFQAGVYRFDSAMSPAQISQQFIDGKVYDPVVAEITIPEGFTSGKTISRLVANNIGRQKNLSKLVTNKKYLSSHKIPGKSVEGFLYPATYRFTKRLPTGREAFDKMITTFWENLPKNYQENVEKAGLTLEKAVIFASLIELETRYDDERSKVSEVIWRRLKTSQYLGIDAALIYGIIDYRGDITWKHLRDASNKYNLRKHKGLPPTAIGSPGKKSLQAVLTPTNLGNNFYVLKVNGDGRHHFSKNLKEHNKFVKLFVESTKRK